MLWSAATASVAAIAAAATGDIAATTAVKATGINQAFAAVLRF